MQGSRRRISGTLVAVTVIVVGMGCIAALHVFGGITAKALWVRLLSLWGAVLIGAITIVYVIRHQRALARSEAKFRMVTEHSVMAILIARRDRVVFANLAAEHLLGYSAWEMRTWQQNECYERLVYPEDLPFVRRYAMRRHGGPKGTVVPERTWRAVTKSGEVKWLATFSTGIIYDGEPAILVSATDITERRRAEENLRESQANLEITLNSIGDAVMATDADGKVVRMNPVAEVLTGWSATEAVGTPVADVFRVSDIDTHGSVESSVESILRDGSIVTRSRRMLLRAKNGEECRIADSGAPILDRTGEIVGAVLVFRDVTEETALQDQLRQSQKMEAIGQLAGGVAHDFNNLLTGILGNAQLLAMDFPEGSDSNRRATEIVDASSRAAGLTRQLLTFSRKGKLRRIGVDIHRIIGEVVGLLGHSIDRNIRIKKEFDASPAISVGDPAQLQNAILNLGVNARDAMPDGGDLVFSTRNVVLDETYCNAHPDGISPGTYIEIAVTDTGIGMDAKIQQRIFEPFFTTKSESEGTGLGLAGVYSCVKNHHGLVHVYSELNKGSRFKILLPLAPDASEGLQPAGDGKMIRGSGSILLVDDEEIVRNFASKALEDLGYAVSTCTNGAEAVEFCQQHVGELDLVILDLIMPTLGGADAFRLMRVFDPDIRVLISSGFARNNVVARLLREGAVGFLNKPFRIAELSRQVARFIGADAAGVSQSGLFTPRS